MSYVAVGIAITMTIVAFYHTYVIGELNKELDVATKEVVRTYVVVEDIDNKYSTVIDYLNNILSITYNQEVTPLTRAKSLKVTVTAYTASPDETNNDPSFTADMTPSRIGLLAVSRDLLRIVPYGTRVVLEGYGMFVVADTMNKRFVDRVDILHATKEAARKFGIKKDISLVYLK